MSHWRVSRSHLSQELDEDFCLVAPRGRAPYLEVPWGPGPLSPPLLAPRGHPLDPWEWISAYGGQRGIPQALCGQRPGARSPGRWEGAAGKAVPASPGRGREDLDLCTLWEEKKAAAETGEKTRQLNVHSKSTAPPSHLWWVTVFPTHSPAKKGTQPWIGKAIVSHDITDTKVIWSLQSAIRNMKLLLLLCKGEILSLLI